MKKLLIIAFSLIIVACVASTSEKEDEKIATVQSDLTLFPKCNKLLEGVMLYQNSTQTIVACVNNNWINVPLPVGPKGDKGDPGSQGIQGNSGSDGVCTCNSNDAGVDSGSDASVCPPSILPPSCQSGSLVNSNCLIQCYGNYYPPNSLSGNGGACGGGLVEGPGDGSNSCFCLPTGGGAPNSGCPSDGQLHYYVNGVWQ